MGALGSELIWQNVFMFRTEHNCCESLAWRKYAPSIADVHNLGCSKQRNDRAAGRNSTYFGALTGNAGNVRNLRSKNGGRFEILHAPDEGIHHVHITFQNVERLTKSDKTELKVLIRGQFAARSEHQCADIPDSSAHANP